MAMSGCCWLIGGGVLLFERLGKWFKVLLCITFIANWNLKCVRKLEMGSTRTRTLDLRIWIWIRVRVHGYGHRYGHGLGFIAAEVWFFWPGRSYFCLLCLFGQGPCPLPVLAFVLRVNMSWKLACLVLWSLVGRIGWWFGGSVVESSFVFASFVPVIW